MVTAARCGRQAALRLWSGHMALVAETGAGLDAAAMFRALEEEEVAPRRRGRGRGGAAVEEMPQEGRVHAEGSGNMCEGRQGRTLEE
ncbi:hypothetical protein [Streptomyces sp. NPDC026589]|uniref:hypothetical protein n=1 Tax=Streptomyces sp. NPDC026589 TaxID=3155609 RepID=UPI0033C54ACD